VNQRLPEPPRTRLRVKVAALTTLVLAAGGIAVGVVRHVRADSPNRAKARDRSTAVEPKQLAHLMAAPHLLFEDTDLGHAYRKLEVVPLTDPSGPRAITPFTCDRVATAQKVGVCLATNRGVVTTYKAEIFDQTFKVLHTFFLPGLPSRVRLSPDGHWAAITVFVKGDNYASEAFATRTTFVDTATAKHVGGLEQFHVTDGNAKVATGRRTTGASRSPPTATSSTRRWVAATTSS